MPHRAKQAAAAVSRMGMGDTAKGRSRNDSVTKRGIYTSAGGRGAGAAPPPPPAKGRTHGRSFSSFPQARAMFEYSPTTPQELELKVGMVVKVVEKFEDGWWNAEANGKTGLVPGNYMELL